MLAALFLAILCTKTRGLARTYPSSPRRQGTPRQSGGYARPVRHSVVRLELQSIGQGLAGWHYLCVVIFNVGHGQELHRLALEENLEGQSVGWEPLASGEEGC